MDKEIKRLLKLSNIPGFQLAKDEEKKLKDWKKAQEPVKVKKPRRKRKKTTNEVKPEIKNTGTIELENAVPIIPIVHEMES